MFSEISVFAVSWWQIRPGTPLFKHPLKRYAALGVPEVWFWQRGQLMVYQLMGASYQRVEAIQFAPDIDLTALAACASTESRAQAVRAFRARA
jgi:hypothetical protein